MSLVLEQLVGYALDHVIHHLVRRYCSSVNQRQLILLIFTEGFVIFLLAVLELCAECQFRGAMVKHHSQKFLQCKAQVLWFRMKLVQRALFQFKTQYQT